MADVQEINTVTDVGRRRHEIYAPPANARILVIPISAIVMTAACVFDIGCEGMIPASRINKLSVLNTLQLVSTTAVDEFVPILYEVVRSRWQ